MTNTTNLFWNNYRYFPYEKNLAHREIETLLQPENVQFTPQGIRLKGNLNETHLNRLAYFQKYSVNGKVFDTLQHKLESTCIKTGRQNRQSTRYSVHGIHEYKGKFNPQIVRAILNILNIQINSNIIDPFCGSGTTLVECSHTNVRALGCDINPMAVFISNAKIQALSVPFELLDNYLEQVVSAFRSSQEKNFIRNNQTIRENYLSKWFTENIFLEIELLKTLIEDIGKNTKNIFLAIASDFLREYSLQEPFDLRIRRRKSPLPEKPFIDEFYLKAKSFIENLKLTQVIIGVREQPNYAYLCDSRKIVTESKNKIFTPIYDAAITSPPYATALPYIDTQRLSLVWLGLISPDEIRNLDAELTGSREFSTKQKSLWQNNLFLNHNQLTENVYEFCQLLENAVDDDDGFRRQAVPSLMYRYFSDMKDVFRNIHRLVKSGAPFALVVGHNQTTLGGKIFNIDTPELLKEVAVSCGWQHEESIPLQTYQRYGLHSANSVKAETLLILRKHDQL